MPDEAVRVLNNFGTILMILFITSFAIAFILKVVDKQVNLNEGFKKFQKMCALVAPAFLIIGIMLYVFAYIF